MMWSVQFSKDGVLFFTLQKFSEISLAESVMKACAGHGAAFGHAYWRVRQSDQASKDFHAVMEESK